MINTHTSKASNCLSHMFCKFHFSNTVSLKIKLHSGGGGGGVLTNFPGSESGADSLFLKSSKFEDGACLCAVKYFKHNNIIKTYWYEYFLSCCGPEIFNVRRRFERYFSHHRA